MKLLIAILTALAVLYPSAAHGFDFAKEPKAIEIMHMSRIMFAGRPLGFQVRLRPIDTDRMVYAVLCDRTSEAPCTTREFEHERLSQYSIEGDAATRMWSPKAWERIAPGDYVLVVTIGSTSEVRASDQLTLQVRDVMH